MDILFTAGKLMQDPPTWLWYFIVLCYLFTIPGGIKNRKNREQWDDGWKRLRGNKANTYRYKLWHLLIIAYLLYSIINR